MSRSFALAVGLLAAAAPARAADPEPEKLLSPTTQLYLRWDGVAAHNDAYKKSIWGGVMAGPTGDSIRALVAKVPRLLGNSLLADPLLDGKPPAELKANLADLKQASQLIELVADRGVVVAAELREPRPTLKGVGAALGGLVGGKPDPETFIPDAQLFVIVPDAGDKSEALFAAIRLLLRQTELTAEPLPAAAGRKGFRLVMPKESNLPVQVHAAWWTEGKHFVLYVGTTRTEAVFAEVAANAKQGGLTGHPLFQRIKKNPGFESVARGFVDAGRLIPVIKGLAGPFVPGLAQRIDDVGLGGLKAVVFNSGFDGKESRATWEFDLPGERKGFAKVLKQQPLGLNDLPPMPPDVSRFAALRVDPEAVYDAGVSAVEAVLMNDTFGPEEDAKTPAEKIRLRREYLMREADKFAGVSVKDELLPVLGDKVVMFQGPAEGLSAFGTVVCISLKDPAKAKQIGDRVQRAVEAIANAPVKVRKKTCRGVEIREFYSRGFGILTPTYAIVGDWLVVSAYPQAVQGFVLRSKGELPTWKPDPETAARLAKLPADGCGLQFCDPKSTAQNLCCIGPLFLNTFALRDSFNDNGKDFDPLDVGLVPNAHELSRHLFPNLTVTRDDGKTVKIEVNESFSVPLEFIGLEPLAFAGLVFGLRF